MPLMLGPAAPLLAPVRACRISAKHTYRSLDMRKAVPCSRCSTAHALSMRFRDTTCLCFPAVRPVPWALLSIPT